jgi:hypothetical protein
VNGSLAACGENAREGVASMDVAEHIISLERSALVAGFERIRTAISVCTDVPPLAYLQHGTHTLL